MPEARRAATLYSSAAYLATLRGPERERYAIPLDLGELFRWEVGSTLTADGITVLGHQGGTAGRWLRVRRPDQGEDLGDADVTITVGQGAWRRIPAATLTANRTITLGTTNAAAGDVLELTRLDVSAFTVSVVNGGPGAGTLCTLPISARSWVRAYFDGDNWIHRASGLML